MNKNMLIKLVPRWIVIFQIMLFYAKLAGANNETPESLDRLGLIAYEKKDYARAINFWKRSCEIKITADCLFNLAQAYRKSGDLSKALFRYEDYLRNARPGDLVIHRSETEELMAELRATQEDELAQFYMRSGQYDAAIGIWQSAFRAKERPIYLFYIGKAYLAMRRLKPALLAFDQFAAAAEAKMAIEAFDSFLQDLDTGDIIQEARLHVAELRAKLYRPIWYPFVEVGASFALYGRNFSFHGTKGAESTCYRINTKRDPAGLDYNWISCPNYVTALTAGLRFIFTVYPFAGIRNNLIRGLGINGIVDIPFWPSRTAISMEQPDKGPQKSAATGFRAEIGIRWNWNILHRRNSPSPRIQAQYGIQRLAFDTISYLPNSGYVTTDDHGFPQVQYQYINFSLGGQIPYYASEKFYIGMTLDLHYYVVFETGDIGEQFTAFNNPVFYGGYGPSSNQGFRIDATALDVSLIRGLHLQLQGYYEYFHMVFDLGNGNKGYPLPPYPPPSPLSRTQNTGAFYLAQSASDHGYGLNLGLSYLY